MPELPEVEVVARGLRNKVVGLTIDKVSATSEKVVDGSLKKFKKFTQGAKIKSVQRVGKLLIIHLSNKNVILLHLKLTGQLIYVDRFGKGYKGGHSQKAYDTKPPSKYTHITFAFNDRSHLYFNDLRRFGWAKVFRRQDLEERKQEAGKILAGLGPDPMGNEFSLQSFLANVKRRAKSNIYQVLMDQKVVAGLGNIYVNELLWRAKVNPKTKVAKMPKEKILFIGRGIKPILEEAISYGGSSANTFVKIDGSKGKYTDRLAVYQRQKQPCPRKDKGVIARVSIGGRGAFYCPICQKEVK